jgi:hypothetical protein
MCYETLSSKNFVGDRLKIAIDADINNSKIPFIHQMGTPLCQHLRLS